MDTYPHNWLFGIKQGSDDWLRYRLGKITGTRFKDVLANPQGVVDKIRDERLMLEYGELPEPFDNAAMRHGRKTEPMARNRYEIETGLPDLVSPAFIEHPDYPLIGVSPDGAWSDARRGFEIKCPYKAKNHANTLSLGMPDFHIGQVQGFIWVAELDCVDFVSFSQDKQFSPEEQIYIETINRDEHYIDRLEHQCLIVLDALESGKETAKPDQNIPKLF